MEKRVRWAGQFRAVARRRGRGGSGGAGGEAGEGGICGGACAGGKGAEGGIGPWGEEVCIVLDAVEAGGAGGEGEVYLTGTGVGVGGDAEAGGGILWKGVCGVLCRIGLAITIGVASGIGGGEVAKAEVFTSVWDAIGIGIWAGDGGGDEV